MVNIFELNVELERGVHARPATQLVRLLMQYDVAIEIQKKDTQEWVDGKSIMDVLTLAAEYGSTLLFKVSADAALTQEVEQHVRRLFEQQLPLYDNNHPHA